MRKIILIVLGIIIIAGSVFGAIYIVKSNTKTVGPNKTIAKPIAVKTVKNATIPVVVKTNGQVTALNKFELFSEVQGIFEQSDKLFRPGQAFKKDETLVKINNEEFVANLKSAKSEFYNLLISILPDIRLDYPEHFEKWNTYIEEFSVHESLQPLPEIESSNLKYFINGRGVITSFFNIKNLEVRLAKFHLKAPFDGILTEASITPGTLVRPGQRLGEFIKPGEFELEVALQKALVDYVEIGDTVNLFGIDKKFQTKGKITRINTQVDSNSQSVQTFIMVNDPRVKEGMYLEAEIYGQLVKNAYKISRSLVRNNAEVFIVKDSVLALKQVKPVYYDENTAIIKGLANGDTIMTSNLSSAYSGMLIKLKK